MKFTWFGLEIGLLLLSSAVATNVGEEPESCTGTTQETVSLAFFTDL